MRDITCKTVQVALLEKSQEDVVTDPRVLAHLEACATCRGFAALVPRIGDERTLDEPSASLDRAVLTAARKHQVRRPVRVVAFRPLWLAAAACLVLGVALRMYLGGGDGRPEPGPHEEYAAAQWEDADLQDAMLLTQLELDMFEQGIPDDEQMSEEEKELDDSLLELQLEILMNAGSIDDA